MSIIEPEFDFTLSGLDRRCFEGVVDGKAVRLYVLSNAAGAEATVCNYGGIIPSIMMPDRDGRMANVVLGMDSLDGLMNGPEPFLGATIGRYGNRIAGAKFAIDGVEYCVTMSQKPNCLHGGKKGFHAVVWDAEQVDGQTIRLHYTAADGEEGFPGRLDVVMTYTLTDENELRIDYRATTDRPTVCNLTNHAFFNLTGTDKIKSEELRVKSGELEARTVDDYLLTMMADAYLPIDEVSIPYGERAPVAGTPFDFRTPHRVGDRIDADHEQTRHGAGYDHSFCLRKAAQPELEERYGVRGITLAAVCEDPLSGRMLETYTTEPGVQVYTGNWLSGFEGQHSWHYPRRSAICFEAQHHPDAPNKPQFESTVLRPGEVYTQTTVYKFSTRR